MYGSGYVDGLGVVVDAAGNLLRGAGDWYNQNKNNVTKIKNGKIVTEKGNQGRSALPNLPRSVNTNLAAYDSSVRTPVGGGNAGQAQSQDPNAPAYIAPSEPRTVTTPGRDAAPPRGGDDRGAKGTQMSSSSRMDVLYNRLNSPQGDGGFGIPFRFEGNAPTMASSTNQQQTNTQYATQDEAFAAAYKRGEVSPYLKGYTGDMNDRHAQMSYAYNHGFTGAMDFGRQGANPQAGNSSVPDEAEAQTEVSFPGAAQAQSEFESFVKEDRKPKPRRRPRGERAGAMFDRQGGFEEDTYESKTTGRPRRNTSFLDYDGPGGSMMALRALEASQGTMKQNGVTYGRDSTGKWVQMSGEAAAALKNDRSSVATVDFVDSHRYKPVVKETAEQEQPTVPSLAQAPQGWEVPEGASPTFKPPAGEGPALEAQIQTRDIPYEVKEANAFLSERLKNALGNIGPTQ